MKWMRSRRGQIVIPAMLMFPTLFLFVYLIYETAKLSREKIRHQFAMDAAAFVEMTNYSDFLNRTAYVNGAFPMRIFEEGYYDFPASCDNKMEAPGVVCPPTADSYAKMLFDNGAFPHLGGAYINNHLPETQTNFNGLGKWNIEYDPRFSTRNDNPPDFNVHVAATPPSLNANYYELFTEHNSDQYWQQYPLVSEIYKLYNQIYSLLGSVEDAQFMVLERLTTGNNPQGGHSFMQKSYWLNTGDSPSDATVLASSFNAALGISSNDFKSVVHPACLTKLDYFGNVVVHGALAGIQPFQPQMTTTSDGPYVDLTKLSNNGCQSQDGGTGGLFQVEYLDQSMVNKDGTSGVLQKGLTIQMPWAVPSTNFFKVNFNQLMSQQTFPGMNPGMELRTTVSLIGDPSTSPAVWPDPTPKFQVRQFP